MPRSTGRNVFLTSGVGTSDPSRNLLVAVLHSFDFLLFHPARHIDVGMTKWFARLLRHLLGRKPGGELLENCAPIKPESLGWGHGRRCYSRLGPAHWSLQHALPARGLCLERGEFVLTLGNLLAQSG